MSSTDPSSGRREGWPPNEHLDRHFEVVTAARAAISGASKDLPDTTKDEYKSKAAQINEAMKQERNRPSKRPILDRVFSRYAPVGASFFKYRAALAYRYTERIRHSLRVQDELQREGTFEAWHNELERLTRLKDSLILVHNLDRAQLLKQTQQLPTKLKTKRFMVRRLARDWQRTVVAQARIDKKYYLPILTMALTGCRPSEVFGTRFQLINGKVRVVIAGSKVTKENGQEKRQFEMDPSRIPMDLLLMLQTLQFVDIKELEKETDRTALRVYLNRMGKTLWPRSKVIISPILFRHQMAANLKASDWESCQIAGVLGHASENTQNRYGVRSKKGKGTLSVGIDPKSIKTSKPIRAAKTSAFLSKTPPTLKNGRRPGKGTGAKRPTVKTKTSP